MPKSRYVVVIDNISTVTRTKDIRYEAEMAGAVLDVAKDDKARCALVEYKRSSDAEYAWKKLHGIKVDGRQWKLDFATPDDFKFFGWKWTEGGTSNNLKYEDKKTSHKKSPTPSVSSSRERSRSPERLY